MKFKFFFVLTIGFFSINLNCVRLVRIEGNAMKPVLNDGDRIFLNTNVGELNAATLSGFIIPFDTSMFYIKKNYQIAK